MLALGIDVGAPRKGLDLVLLDGGREPVRVVSKVGIDRLGLLIGELKADVIAIDAPPAWAPNGSSRLTERLLAQCNIHAFNTPSAREGSGHPFYAWMESGFQVFAVVAARGYPRYRAGGPRGTAMEVFPHGSAAVLAGIFASLLVACAVAAATEAARGGSAWFLGGTLALLIAATAYGAAAWGLSRASVRTPGRPS